MGKYAAGELKPPTTSEQNADSVIDSSVLYDVTFNFRKLTVDKLNFSFQSR